MKFKYLLAAALVLSAFATDAAIAQQRVKVPITNKEWEQPFPGFKIVGNLYYVGTYDLGCYLIDTGAGLILVNSGAPGSYPLIKASIEALGFKTSDIKIITSTHGHFDHVGDLASVPEGCPGRQDLYERARCAGIGIRAAISITGAPKGAASSTTRSRSMCAPSPATISSSATPT